MSRIAFWSNDNKAAANQPDGRGSVEIDQALAQEIAQALATGQGWSQDVKGAWVLKLDLSVWRSNGQNPKAPIVSGQIAGVAQTAENAAKLAAWKAQQQNGGATNGWMGAPAPAPAPAYQQPPVAAPAPPQAPPMMAPPAPAPMAPPAPPAAPPSPPAAPAPAPSGWQSPVGF